MSTLKERSRDLVLGIFVAAGLVVLVAFIFVIGRERRMFDKSVSIEAHFPNVAGLAVGADVMLAGVVVGHVAAIKFPILKSEVPGLSRDVTIVMDVSASAMKWIREDSIARIDSKGLLGDKIINIAIGSSELAQMQVGGMLKSTPPVDFNKALQQAQEILENVTETVSDARDVFKGFVAEGGDEALANSAKSVERILKEVEDGEGVLHELVFDKKAGKDTKELLASVKDTVKKLEKVSKDLNEFSHRVKNEENLLNALLYDKKGKETIKNINQTFAEMSAMLGEVKNGSGILHDLIFAEDKGQFLASLNEAALDLKTITNDVKSGKGSLGLLLTDPSIYNELYGLLGNLRRNQFLKAVIRYGVSRQEDPTNKKD